MTILGRIAVREARRNWVRTLLIAVLTAVPVAVVVGVIVMMPAYHAGNVRSNVQRTGQAEFQLDLAEPTRTSAAEVDEIAHEINRRVGAGGTIVPSISGVGYRRVAGDRLEEFQLEEVDMAHSMMRDRFPNLEGRLPQSPGEALIHVPEPLEAWQSGWEVRHAPQAPGIGDTVTLESHFIPNTTEHDAGEEPVVNDAHNMTGSTVTVTIVGSFKRQERCYDCRDLALYPNTLPEGFFIDLAGSSIAYPSWYGTYPETLHESERYDRLADLSTGLPLHAMVTDGSEWDTSFTGPERLIVVVGATFLLFWTGLLAACGFAIGARRRRRQLGLLAANGADPARLRAVSVSEALLVGLMGSTAGVLCGLVGMWTLYQLFIPDQYSDLAYVTGFSPFKLHLSDIGLIVAVFGLGVVSCVAAASVATKGLSRQTPAELLSGRLQQPRSVSVWLLSGAALFAIGFGIYEWATSQNGELPVWAISLGLGLAIIGAVGVVVGAIRVVGIFTRSGRLSVRIAARDLVRQGVRTGAAASAVCLTIGLGVTGIVGLEPLPEEYYLDGGWYQTSAWNLEIPTANDDSSGWQEKVYPASYALGAPGAWVEVASFEFERHDIGFTVPYTLSDASIAEIRDAGWTVSSYLRGPAPVALQLCNDLDNLVCERTVTVVDEPTIDLLPTSIAHALRTQGEANLVDPDAYVDTPTGPDPLHYVDVDETCPGCRLSFMYDLHHVIMTKEQAAQRGVDLNNLLNSQQVSVQVSATDTRVRDDAMAALAADVPEGAGLRTMMFDGSYNETAQGRVNLIFRTYIAVAVNVISVLVITVSLALVRLESRSEDEVLVVCGASPSLARRINSWRSVLIVVAASIPAVPIGILIWRLGLEQPNIPWRWIGILISTLIVVAALTGVVVGRRDFDYRSNTL